MIVVLRKQFSSCNRCHVVRQLEASEDKVSPPRTVYLSQSRGLLHGT